MLGPVVAPGALLFCRPLPTPFPSLGNLSPLAPSLGVLTVAEAWGLLGARLGHGGFWALGPLTSGRISCLCCAAGGGHQPGVCLEPCAVPCAEAPSHLGLPSLVSGRRGELEYYTGPGDTAREAEG